MSDDPRSGNLNQMAIELLKNLTTRVETIAAAQGELQADIDSLRQTFYGPKERPNGILTVIDQTRKDVNKLMTDLAEHLLIRKTERRVNSQWVALIGAVAGIAGGALMKWLLG